MYIYREREREGNKKRKRRGEEEAPPPETTGESQRHNVVRASFVGRGQKKFD